MATSIDQKNYIKTALRLPPELHAAVHESAQKNGRSYNAELVERIQASVDGGASQELVLDQANQIWELRKKLSKSFLVLSRAAIAIREAGLDDKELIDLVQAELTASSRNSFEVLEKMAGDLAKDRGLSGAEYLMELLGLTESDTGDTTQKQNPRSRKPKP